MSHHLELTLNLIWNKESDWKSYVQQPIAGWKNFWNNFIAVIAVILNLQREKSYNGRKIRSRMLNILIQAYRQISLVYSTRFFTRQKSIRY